MVVDPCGGRAPMTTHQHLPCTGHMDVKSQVDVHKFLLVGHCGDVSIANRVLFMKLTTDDDR